MAERFPGDRGRGADVPLENVAREDMAGPQVNYLLRQIKPREQPRSLKPKNPPIAQKIGAELPPLTGDVGKDLPLLTGDLGADLGVKGPLAPQSQGRSPLLRGLEAMQSGLGKAAAVPFRLAGQLDVASGIKTPEQAESRAQTYGGLTRDLAQASLVPWSKLGQVGRILTGGGLGAAQTPGGLSERLRGGLIGAAGQGVGDLAATGARALASAPRYRMFSKQSANELAEYLRQNIPAWSGMQGKRALYDMARESGPAKLSDDYATALMGAVNKIPEGTTVNLNAEAARKAGFAGAKDVVDSMGNVAVNARKLMESLPNFSKNQTLRREVLDALDSGLPPGIIPEAAMRAYRTGAGFMEFAKKSGLFKKGERYDAATAQRALRDVGKETLERRGMGEARKIIRGPLTAEPITKGTAAVPAAALGATFGGIGTALPFGLLAGGGGAAGGGWLGSQLGRHYPIYRNVPAVMPRLAGIDVADARRALIQALGQRMQSPGVE